jgi:hypothetical protein
VSWLFLLLVRSSSLLYLLPSPVASHHKQLGREDSKIENHNKKVRAAHENMVTKQRRLQELVAFGTSRDGAHEKAMTALEKSTIAFDKAVDGVKSLAGTGSGKVPLLLPRASVYLTGKPPGP